MSGVSLLVEQRQDSVGKADDWFIGSRAKEMMVAKLLDRVRCRIGDF